jgi:hypothetical protein
VPLQVRSIAISIAVVFFFVLGLVSYFSGLAPFTCCKRAVLGAVLAYIVSSWAVKAINSILINAMVTSQMKQKEKESGGKD